jgi:hypothetical protein
MKFIKKVATKWRKHQIGRKLIGVATSSSTVTVAGILAAIGTAGAIEPGILEFIMEHLPERWHGVAIAITGAVVALARVRKELQLALKKDDEE